jgi:hypothetical protein
MASYFVKSGSGVLVLSNRAWSLGERMVPTRTDASSNAALARNYVWEVTTAGTSNGTPTWSASVTADSTTVTQNGVVWTARKPGYSSGSTVNWTFATISLEYLAQSAATILAAGDRIYFSQNHNYSAGASLVYTLPGTAAAPNELLCVDDSVTSGFTLTTGALETVTAGNFTTTIAGAHNLSGVSFTNAGTSNTNGFILSTGSDTPQNYESMQFLVTGGGGITSRINIGNTSNLSNGPIRFRNVDVKLTSTNGKLQLNGAGFEWLGGSFLSGGSGGELICRSTVNIGKCQRAIIEGVDYTNCAAGTNLTSQVDSGAYIKLLNIKTPASWSGAPHSGTPTAGGRVEVINADNADTHGQVWIDDSQGTVRKETTIVKNGGATDGSDQFSYKMVSNSLANFFSPLRSQIISFPNAVVGSSITVTINTIHSSIGAGSGGALQDDQIWLEARYLGTSGYPIGSRITDSKTNVLSTAADQASSSATWASSPSTPLGNDISVTFTPREIGVVQLFVCLAKPSATAYFDPDPVIT